MYCFHRTFDIEDIAQMEEYGTFESVILHEMGHVIGTGYAKGSGRYDALKTAKKKGFDFWRLNHEQQQRANGYATMPWN